MSVIVISLIVFEVLLFVALLVIFRRVMQKNVVSATQHLDDLSHDYDLREKKITQEMDEAKKKAQDIIAGAQGEAAKGRDETMRVAQQEKDAIIAQARARADETMQQADKARQQLLGELDQRIAREAIHKACDLIQETLPEEFKKIVHAHWVEDLIANGFQKLDRLHLPEGVDEVKVVGAFPLQEEERRRLTQRLTEIVGRDVSVQEEVDPAMIAGLAISIGSLVLDGTLRNKIQERALKG